MAIDFVFFCLDLAGYDEESLVSSENRRHADEFDNTIDEGSAVDETHGGHEADQHDEGEEQPDYSVAESTKGILDVTATAHIATSLSGDEDDEMVPPRVTRPLPPPPPEEVENASATNQQSTTVTNVEPSSPPPPPPRSKRRSMPPPRSPLPPPPVAAPLEIPENVPEPVTVDIPAIIQQSNESDDDEPEEGDSRDIESDDYGQFHSGRFCKPAPDNLWSKIQQNMTLQSRKEDHLSLLRLSLP